MADARICSLFAFLLTLVVSSLCLRAGGVEGHIRVRISKAPKAFSSSTSAAFKFEVAGDCRNCSTRCKLDDHQFSNCEGNGALYVGLPDGEHKFEVCINGPQGENCDAYSWIVDTVPPTASISAASAFTSASHVSVNVSFSEPCTGGGGFQCSENDCKLLTYGAGYVVPSTLKVLQPYMVYALSVSISRVVRYGRIVLVLDKNFCTDAAGNMFSRTPSSRFFLHFDRRNVSVVISTSITKMLLPINNVIREVEATNNDNDLNIYLHFSRPILNSSTEILKSLHVSTGALLPINRSNMRNRQFGFLVKNVPRFAIVTVNLDTSSILSRYGIPVSQTDLQTFLYDTERPSVKLSTSKARTREHYIPVYIKFLKPVFNFNASALLISGGNLTGFRKISMNSYTAGIQFIENTVSITVPESVACDVAGNENLASNVLLLHHYSVPMVSSVLSLVTSALFSVTSFTAIFLTISTEVLLSVGAFSRSSSYSASEPSRSLMRMIFHIQVFAQSKWLPVTLPVEYYEFVRGLQWSIPYLCLPWETKSKDFTSSNTISSSTASSKVFEADKLLMSQFSFSNNGEFRINAPKNGAPLTPMEYMTFFEDQNLKPQAEVIDTSRISHGWKEFERNMVWLAIIGGGLIWLHALILVILKLRRKSSETKKLYGALVFPRFEIFLLFLALPCICQASATIIKGKSIDGVITGSLLLAVVSIFLVFLLFFVYIGITMGKFLHYKEVHQEGREVHWYQGIESASLGPGKKGKWTWKDQPDSVLLTRLGPFFEDLRGPTKYRNLQETNERRSKCNEMVIVSDDVDVPFVQKLFGILRIYYTLLDCIKRISVGIIAGVSSSERMSRKPVVVVLCIASCQLFFLALKKPFIKQNVQFVELISVTSEVGIFAICIFFLKDSSEFQQQRVGYSMLALFTASFVSQMINEWYALYRQVLQLSPDGDSFTWGIKTFIIGLLSIFFPSNFLSGLDERLSSLGDGESRKSMSSSGQKDNNSGGNERSWIRQLREIAKESFSRDDGKDPSSSCHKPRMENSSVSTES